MPSRSPFKNLQQSKRLRQENHSKLSMHGNKTFIETSSQGAWQGDNPLNYAFPLLIIQTILVLVVSRLLAFLLKPLRQPKVIAEILGGIVLGPSALGRNKDFLQSVFPSWSTPILESVASIGLLFFLFLVGLELDLSSIRSTGKRAFSIALAGISLPFALGAGVTFLLRRLTHNDPSQAGYGQTLIFMGVALSITAFPVLARILAELKLLTTQVGETAMAAAAFNDVAAWILLALAIAITGHNGPSPSHQGPLTSLWVLSSGLAFVAFMMGLVRPAMGRVAQKCSPEADSVDEAYIGLTLAGVMLSGFMTDLIGIHSIFGAFVFGLTIPKGAFAGRLIKRIEDFVSTLLLPLYFASSGLKTDVGKISGAEAWGLLGLVISTACAGKIIGTFAVAMMCRIPARESITLGVLMNTKGLVELIVLNIGREKKVLNDEMFAILVLMALFTTFITTPTVMAIYKPYRVSATGSDHQDSEGDESLRVVACVHGSDEVPSMIDLIELMRGAKTRFLKLYGVHLVELTDRPSSILMVRRLRKNGKPFLSRLSHGGSCDRAAVAFEAYGKGGEVSVGVQTTTAISDLATMHEDVCHVAKRKRASVVILSLTEELSHGWRAVNERVLENAPCSVAVLVDRGFGGCNERRVCVLFFGGQGDRDVLELGGRMSEGSTASVSVLRFMERGWIEINTQEKEEDEVAMQEFNRRWGASTRLESRIVESITSEVMNLGRSGGYDLIIVGKGWAPAAAGDQPELGVVGAMLASPGNGVSSSVLVVQGYDHVLKDEGSGSKMVEMTKDQSTPEFESTV